MIRNLALHIEDNTGADEFASGCVGDFYDDVSEYALSEFYDKQNNLSDDIIDKLRIPGSLENELREIYYEVCVEAYERYEYDLESIMGDFDCDFGCDEINEAESQIANMMVEALTKQLKEIKGETDDGTRKE